MKKVIELCEDSIERNDRHMIIQGKNYHEKCNKLVVKRGIILTTA